MLRPAKEFKNLKVRARGGDVGRTRECYFDVKHWTLRYLVANSGGWVNGR